MSITQFPRVYFRGEISWDPGLGNNFNVYDPAHVRLNVPTGMSLAELEAQLPTALPGSWNHFGTHRAIFENVRIKGVSLGPGQIDDQDVLVDQPLVMNGKLVDLNPAADHGTQVFFDEIRLGNLAGGLIAKRRKRMFMRYLNFARNRVTDGGPATNAGAVWEVCFPKDLITLQNPTVSPALKAIELAFGAVGTLGLAMRFHTYFTVYYQNGIKNALPERPRNRTELATLYADGRNFSNAAYSKVAGVIILWKQDEHEGHAGGRMLMPSDVLGVTFFEVDRTNSRVTLDLGETVPERNSSLDKEDYGDLTLIANDSGQETTIATLTPSDYGKDAYERTAGLVDFDLSTASQQTWDAIERGALHLRPATQPESVESIYVVVVEDRDVYLNEGDSFSLALKVRTKGRPAANTSILVASYNADLVFIEAATTLQTDDQGNAVFNLVAGEPGMKTYVFLPFAAGSPAPTPTPAFDRSTTFHVNVRTLPADGQLAADTPDSQLTWSWVYENILAVYDVINPVMSRTARPTINRPLDNRAVLEANAAKIKQVVDKGLFESKDYMPVTRDLSDGKRALLQRWCDLVLSGGAPPQPVPPRKVSFTTSDRRVEAAGDAGG